VEAQALAQFDQPGAPVIRYARTLGHLGLRLELGIYAIQGVEYAVTVLDGDRCRSIDRVEDREVGLRNKTQRPRTGGAGNSRHGQSRQCRTGGLQQ
jgi:hypothetical protein